MQAPDQATAVSRSGTPVKVTTVPAATSIVHVAPHEIPAGSDVTLPVPVVATVSVNICNLASADPPGLVSSFTFPHPQTSNDPQITQ